MHMLYLKENNMNEKHVPYNWVIMVCILKIQFNAILYVNSCPLTNSLSFINFNKTYENFKINGKFFNDLLLMKNLILFFEIQTDWIIR